MTFQFFRRGWLSEKKQCLFSLCFVLFFSIVVSPSKSFCSNVDAESGVFNGKPKRKLGNKQKDLSPFNVDINIGGTANIASGKYIRFQESYYETGKEYLVAGGEFSQYLGVTSGLFARVIPYYNSREFKSEISFMIGVQYWRRGLKHKWSMQNLRVTNSTDLTVWDERIYGHYLAIPIMLRVGNKIYCAVGAGPDLFLNGRRTQQIERKVFGPNAFDNGYTTTDNISEKLTNATQRVLGLSYTGSIGFQFVPEFAMQLQANYMPSFFKDQPNFSNLNVSVQTIITFK